MISIHATKEVPFALLAPFARNEALRFNPRVACFRMWEIHEGEKFIGVFMLSLGSLCGSGMNVWFGAGKDLPKLSRAGWRSLRRTMRRLAKLFGHLTAYVWCDHVQGRRLIRFFGFEETAVAEGVRRFELWSALP